MRNILIASVLALGTLVGCGSAPSSGYYGGSGASSYYRGSGGGTVPVRGHFRSNGTYVAPHYRTAPDGIRSNNLSYRGGSYRGGGRR